MKYLQIKEQLLNEINMSPNALRRAAKEIGARAGMEFEMIVPGAAEADDDYDMEPDYDSDQSISSIQDALDLDSVMDQKSFGSVIVESLNAGPLKTAPIRLVVKNLLWYCPKIYFGIALKFTLVLLWYRCNTFY